LEPERGQGQERVPGLAQEQVLEPGQAQERVLVLAPERVPVEHSLPRPC
jgi:hypothetical protein